MKPSPRMVVMRSARIKRNVIDVLYVSSAVLGIVVTYDAYFGSGAIKDREIRQEIEIIEKLNKTDKEILQLMKHLDEKIDINSKAITQYASTHRTFITELEHSFDTR